MPATLAKLASIFLNTARSIDDASPADPSRIEAREPDPADQRYRILANGGPRWEASDPDLLLGALEWTVTSEAIASIGRRCLLFHGGVVALGKEGVILPASVGSGKTTLVAGLLRFGFRYLSDDIVVYDPTSRELLPFARSLCVKDGSRPVLEPLFPGLSTLPRYRRFGNDLATYLPPPVGSDPEGPILPRHLVFPRYVVGAETRLRPIARSAALQGLLEQSFNARQLGSTSIETAVKLVRELTCWSLTSGDLIEAIDAVENCVVSMRSD
jgi:hypothetical protein